MFCQYSERIGPSASCNKPQRKLRIGETPLTLIRDITPGAMYMQLKNGHSRNSSKLYLFNICNNLGLTRIEIIDYTMNFRSLPPSFLPNQRLLFKTKTSGMINSKPSRSCTLRFYLYSSWCAVDYSKQSFQLISFYLLIYILSLGI